MKRGSLVSSAPRILLVDDDPIMRELAHEKLNAANYQVAIAENGADALTILKRDGADLVISDLEMPVMDGFELTREIRADRAIAQTPVIVITASDHADAVDRAFAAGATSFLAKPINWTLFNQAVKFVLRASNDQRALRLARDQAEAGAKYKDGLMSVMSHELRTPLNAIIGFGQLLGERFAQQNDPLHKEYADYIIDSGKRLLNTISDMLLASDAGSGPIAIAEAETTVGDIIAAARTISAGVAATTQAEVVEAVQDVELTIICDQRLVARALSKLIDNAAKFSPRGAKIIIGAALTKGGELALMVKDTGPGMAPDRLKRVLAPFTQSDMSLKRAEQGLGLGLPLAGAIARAPGAQLRMNSTVGIGTRAVIMLPADRVRSTNSRRARNAA